MEKKSGIGLKCDSRKAMPKSSAPKPVNVIFGEIDSADVIKLRILR